jgi:hypothetical protein
VSIFAFIISAVFAASAAMAPAQSYKNTAPESFRANAQVNSAAGGGAASLTFQLDAYTPDTDRERLLAVLKSGGSPAFVEALKNEKSVGFVQAGDIKVAIRYARAQPTTKGGRRIVIVTDGPVFFAGGGALNAAPKAGFDVAVAEFEVDVVGLGSGSIAAAAKVKSGGATGVQIDDYAQQPIKLVTVTRSAS